MNILDAYEQYKIPPALQRHQLEVTAVGLYVIDHWQGSKLNKRALTQAMLLHDMGNIVKFKRPFLGDLEKDAEYWESVQDEFIQKYGRDTHGVTEAIVKELSVRADAAAIIHEMGYNADGKLFAISWEAKIADFADTCVIPTGVAGFDIRIVDLMKRYNLAEDHPKILAWRRNAEEVQENVDVELSNIAEQDFSAAIDVLKKTEI